MTVTNDPLELIKGAELALLDNDVRRDADRVSALLHPDFVEIGRSGRRWTKSEILGELASEREHPQPQTDEWAIIEISPALFLVTYRVIAPQRVSRHASLWDIGGGTPLMRYHQGTVVDRAGSTG